MNKFVLKSTSIDDLKVIERLPIKDERGSFERFFCQESLGQFFRGKTIGQINRTFTKKREPFAVFIFNILLTLRQK